MAMDHPITDSHRKATPRHGIESPRSPAKALNVPQNHSYVGRAVLR
jgi:hypothetical protein